MSKKNDKELIIGLDIGTSKVVVLVGEVSSAGQVDVIGIGTCASRGLKRGVVVNIESTVQSIQRAAEEAELMAGCEIHAAYTGMAGGGIFAVLIHMVLLLFVILKLPRRMWIG